MHESTILSDLKKTFTFYRKHEAFRNQFNRKQKTIQLYFGLYIFVLTLNLLPTYSKVFLYKLLNSLLSI